MNKALLLTMAVLIAGTVRAQMFVNGNLEGIVTGTSQLPDGWLNVPFGDPVCGAQADYGATPDLTDAFGPLYNNAIQGNPLSGSTFVSGLHMTTHDEGIMQSVSGFTVGCTYIIGLHQTVVKQLNSDFLDPSGSWEVFLDNTSLGVTAPTLSNEPPISWNKPWELRTVSFVATANTYMIKFMPRDDDPNIDGAEGLRMGIDSVWIEAPVPGGTVLADLGNDTTLCADQPLLLDLGPNVVDPVWQDGSTGTSYLVTAPGTYWVQVSVGCALDRDTIVVNYIGAVEVDLGDDVELCPDQTVLLNASFLNATYAWSDGSTNATLLATPGALYWVDVTTACGTVRDSVNVALAPVPIVDLGPDRTLCTGNIEVLDVGQAGAHYLWSDGSTGPTLQVDEPGHYIVAVQIGDCAASDAVDFTEADCSFELELPNVFTPNGNGENDLFVPIRSKGIRSMRTVIRNRWGMEIFSTTSLEIRWNGKAPNGDLVPEGTYFWEVQYIQERGDPATRTGSLTLLR